MKIAHKFRINCGMTIGAFMRGVLILFKKKTEPKPSLASEAYCIEFVLSEVVLSFGQNMCLFVPTQGLFVVSDPFSAFLLHVSHDFTVDAEFAVACIVWSGHQILSIGQIILLLEVISLWHFCGILTGLCILVVHLGIVEVLIAVKKQWRLVLMAEAEHPLWSRKFFCRPPLIVQCKTFYVLSIVSLVWSLCEIRQWTFSGAAEWNIWTSRKLEKLLMLSLMSAVRASSE